MFSNRHQGRGMLLVGGLDSHHVKQLRHDATVHVLHAGVSNVELCEHAVHNKRPFPDRCTDPEGQRPPSRISPHPRRLRDANCRRAVDPQSQFDSVARVTCQSTRTPSPSNLHVLRKELRFARTECDRNLNRAPSQQCVRPKPSHQSAHDCL